MVSRKMITDFAGEGVFARIKVVGVGGGGSHAINRMIDANIKGVEFVAVNTDAQDLHYCEAPTKIHIGQTTTRGLGAGADPEKGKKSAEENKEDIYNALKDGRSELRSTIILVDEGADTGPILVLSAPLKIKNIPKRDEDLIKFSKEVQELQKRECDWPAYRMAVKLLAEGRFAIDEDKKVFLDGEYIENGYVMK